MIDKEKKIAELEKAMEAIVGLDCRFDNWKKKCRAYKESYTSAADTMAGVIEDQWQSIEYAQITRADHYEADNSPLEALQSCIEEISTYPPPELLKVIVNQFKHYMHMGGDISLEEAFFGPFKGKSTYSRRRLAENSLYESFHQFVSISKHSKNLSQAEIFDEITQKGKFQTPHLMSIDAIEFYNLNRREEIEQDSFLRNYRRWKNKKNIAKEPG
jgi:hypothetical protein